MVGSWTWLVSVLINLLNDVRTYMMLLEKKRFLMSKDKGSAPTTVASSFITARPPSKEVQDLNERLFNLRLVLIRSLADLQLAIFFCFPNSTWSSQWVGVFGVINAATGIYQMCRGFSKSA